MESAKSSEVKQRFEELEDDCLLNIRQGMLELTILLILNAAGEGGLPLKLITKLCLWMLYNEDEEGLDHIKEYLVGSNNKLKADLKEKIERALNVLVLRKLESWDRAQSLKNPGYITKRSARPYPVEGKYTWSDVGMEKSPSQTFMIEPDGRKALERLMNESCRLQVLLNRVDRANNESQDSKFDIFDVLKSKGKLIRR